MKKVLIVTKEYPPNVYGGAGVHVGHLARELARLREVEVRCFGSQRAPGGGGEPAVRGFSAGGAFPDLDPGRRKALEAVLVGAQVAGVPVDADLAHCHTWYAVTAGLWIKILHGIPLVVTVHSLEPLRPWKEEQLGRGYHLSLWLERTALEAADAVVAVSEETRREVLECYRVEPSRVHVIHNGVDPEVFRPQDPLPALAKYRISPERPYLLFVGRMARQKGLIHLLRALERLHPEVQAVLCAGEADTEEVRREVEDAARALAARRPGVHWIREMVPVPDLVRLYSGAAVFVCPSVYEPFGIINLEAMACGCPVVASRIGGIPEVVADGETGILVPVEVERPPRFAPRDPAGFEAALADAVNRLVADPDRGRAMGRAGRRRVEEGFSWCQIARRTVDLYERLTSPS